MHAADGDKKAKGSFCAYSYLLNKAEALHDLLIELQQLQQQLIERRAKRWCRWALVF